MRNRNCPLGGQFLALNGEKDMTYPNDNRPTTNPTNNNWAGWVVAAVCVIAIIVAAVYYSNRDHTASNTSTSPQTTTGSNTGNTGAPRK
jgi:hypothetical protein